MTSNAKFKHFARVALTLLMVTLAFSKSSYADDLPVPAEETVEKTVVKKSKRQRKFLNLTVGVEYDEKLPIKMKSLGKQNLRGVFRTLVDVQFSAEVNTLRFTPKREGIGTLTIQDSKGRVLAEYRLEIRKSRLDTIARELKGLLGDIEGINIKIVNNKVIVDGQIVIPKDMSRIYTVISQYGDQATSLVTISPMAQKRIAEFIEKDIQNPEVKVRALNDKLILEGVVNSDDESKKAEVIAKAYVQPLFVDPAVRDNVIRSQRPANDGIINLITVRQASPPPPSKIIQMVIHYVELKKDYQKGFNFQFTPSLSDAGSTVTFGTGSTTNSSSGWNITGVIDNLLPKLNWTKQHGYARILESTSLIVQDGKKGVLNSVREIPYTTTTGTEGTLVTAFKDVGIATSITPTILGERSDSIGLAMEFDISSLVGTTNSGPLTSRNKLTSEITVRSGQSAAVGGLISNVATTDYNKIPTGATNPIVSLYASKSFQRDQSQFVVFVTPIIKSSASSGSEKIKRKFRLRD